MKIDEKLEKEIDKKIGGIYIDTVGSNFICTEVKTSAIDNRDFGVCWGPYWSMYDDCDCIGVDVARKLFEDGVIKGSTYVEAMQTETGGKILDVDNPNFDDFTCEVSLFDNEKKEKLQKYYLEYIDRLDRNYDNYVFVALDAPYFEYSDSKFYTISIFVLGKEREFIVNIGCTKYIYYNIEAKDIVKKLII